MEASAALDELASPSLPRIYAELGTPEAAAALGGTAHELPVLMDGDSLVDAVIRARSIPDIARHYVG